MFAEAKAKVILALVVAGACVAGYLYVSHLRSENTELTASNAVLKAENAGLVKSIEKMAADHNSEISRIQTLDAARRTAATAGDQFIIRLDEIDLTKGNTNDPSSDPVAGLNRLNADANRMLEQSSH